MACVASVKLTDVAKEASASVVKIRRIGIVTSCSCDRVSGMGALLLSPRVEILLQGTNAPAS